MPCQNERHLFHMHALAWALGKHSYLPWVEKSNHIVGFIFACTFCFTLVAMLGEAPGPWSHGFGEDESCWLYWMLLGEAQAVRYV